ncbi:MAG TPA: hypothetical protein VFQ35_02020 [Polyangiaceae bacterium]|nr:hypothetical protein [Polyangiaceae bacterium]
MESIRSARAGLDESSLKPARNPWITVGFRELIAEPTRSVASTAFLFAWLSAGHTAGASPKVSAEAQGHFRNGVELLQSEAPNYQDAYDQFKLAYEKSHSWKVLGNLGLCALKLERDGEALADFEEYLKVGGRNVAKSERAAIERDMLLARGNAANVELVASSEGEVIDSRAMSTAGAQHYALEFGTTTLLVRAGTHTFVARDKSGRALTWAVTLGPGSRVTHRFDFDVSAKDHEAKQRPPTEPTVRPALQTESAPKGRADSPLRAVGFVALGASVVTIGAGAVFAVFAKGHERSALQRCSSDYVCDPSARPDFETATSQMRVANVLVVSGAVIGVAGLALVLFGGPGQSEARAEHAFRVTPTFGTGSAGLVARGHF